MSLTDNALSADADAKRAIVDWQLEMAGKSIPTVGHDQWDQALLSWGSGYNDPQLPLLEKFGMPSDKDTGIRVFPGGEINRRFRDYRIEIFGTVMERCTGGISNLRVIDDVNDDTALGGACGHFESNTALKEAIAIDVWRIRLFMRRSNIYLEQIWHAPSRKWLRLAFNTPVHHGPAIKDDASELKRLADGLELFNLAIDASNPSRSGRKAKAEIDPATIRTWSAQYDSVLEAIEREMSNRRSKQFSKYSEIERKVILKRLLPDERQNVIDALGGFTKGWVVALQYTAWQCSQIAVGTWASDRLRDYLQDSDKLNGIKRRRRK